MSQKLEDRIEAMFRRDRLFAWGFVIALWAVIGFVFLSIWQVVDDAQIHTAMIVGAGLVLLFNTAAIGAMVRHYAEDKKHIYTLDIRNLDAVRAQKKAGGDGYTPSPTQA